jgi:hypothetical protein
VRIPWRTPTALAGLVLLAWVGFEIGRAGGDIAPPRFAGPSTLNKGIISGSRIDGKDWSLDYDAVTMSPDGSFVTIAHVYDGRLHQHGKPDVLMRADGVTYNLATNDLAVSGPVTFREDQGHGAMRTLRTTGAQYLGATKTLVLSAPTTITQGSATVKVARIEINFQTGETHLGRIVGTRPGTDS